MQIIFLLRQGKVLTFKQVCLNKDLSEGRDEDKIAERDLPYLNAGCLLPIVCRNIAD